MVIVINTAISTSHSLLLIVCHIYILNSVVYIDVIIVGELKFVVED